jgi:hypothetical protein
MTPEQLDARLTMPTLNGYVLSLFYTPRQHLTAYEAAWRDWARVNPVAVHPAWFKDWRAHKQARAVQATP